MKLEIHGNSLDGHDKRITSLDAKVNDIVSKLAVPLFLVGVSGPVIGALIVFALTKGTK